MIMPLHFGRLQSNINTITLSYYNKVKEKMWRLRAVAMQNVCCYLFAFVAVINSRDISNTTSEDSFLRRQPLTEQDIVALFKDHRDGRLCAQNDICQNRTEMASVYVNSNRTNCCKGND